MSRSWETEYTDKDSSTLERVMILCAAIGLTFALGYVAGRPASRPTCDSPTAMHCEVRP